MALPLVFTSVAWCVGKSLTIDAPFLAYITFFPVIGLISAVPITPGGLGVREGLSIQLWSVMGVPFADAFLMSLLPFLFQVFWGLPGGILFLFNSSDALPPLSQDLGD